MTRGKYRFVARSVISGENNHRTTLKKSDLPLIMELLGSGMEHKEIAEKFEVSKSTIGRIAIGKHWLCKTDQDERYITKRRGATVSVDPAEEERYAEAKKLVFSGVLVREALMEVGMTKEQWISHVAMEGG